MRKRLGIIAFHKGEGPWILAKGDERGLQISGLKVGEVLLLESEIKDQRNVPLALSEGNFLDFPDRITRYRFVKTVEAGVTPSSTCVEVVLK